MTAEAFLRDYPELRPFVLTDVQLTGNLIGGGAYGRVEEATVRVDAAVKTIYTAVQKTRYREGEQLGRIEDRFLQECQLLSALRHPNVVQFLGITLLPGSRLPALVMERLLSNLHDLLVPDPRHLSDAITPLSFFSMALKCSVLLNVASGLAYLHERSPPIIHSDVSARNVLLDSEMVAKISDLGVARNLSSASTVTKGPGAYVYMPPEACESTEPASKFDVSIDVFSLGVLTIFAIGEIFPSKLLPPNYVDPNSGLLVARNELDRRVEYMQHVNEKLQACGQLDGDQYVEDHPLFRLIEQCLHNFPAKRPVIRVALRLLEEAKAGFGDEDSETNKHELLQALQIHPGNHNLEYVIRDLVTENADLRYQVQQLHQEMESRSIVSERELSYTEKKTVKQQLTSFFKRLPYLSIQDLSTASTERDSFDTRSTCPSLDAAELSPYYTPHPKRPMSHSVSQHFVPNIALVRSTTANHPALVAVDVSGMRVSLQPVITAKLQLVTQGIPSCSPIKPGLHIAMISPWQYILCYTPVSRGQHKLYFEIDDKEINGSPFNVMVYPDPSQLGSPVRIVTGLDRPYGIAFNSHQEMIVSEWGGHRLSVIDNRGEKIRTFGSYGYSAGQMRFPKGVAIDEKDDIYVSSCHKVQKFTSSGELIKCVGQKGKNAGEFHCPHGVTIHDNQVYVCDRSNHRIQVFDMDLNHFRSIGSHGKGNGEFSAPHDVKFDTAGNMYVVEWGNGRVQVLDTGGEFLQSFGNRGAMKLRGPSGLYIVDKRVYVSDQGVSVYETSGKFVTSFGKNGQNGGEFLYPRCITSCAVGFIHICDSWNNRIQLF